MMPSCNCCEEWRLTFSESPNMEIETDSNIQPVIGGTYNYNVLDNKPKINGVELIGDKTNEELLINALTNEDIEKALQSFA